MKLRTTFLIAVATLLLTWSAPVARAQVVWPDLMLNGIPKTVNGWTWIPIAGAKCRHGTNTGIAYREGTDPSKLLITLQGGGACFSGTTCAVNPPKFGFDEFKTAANAGKLSGGIWSTVQGNETARYSQVFVPYCTGDLFAGNRVSWIPGVWGEQAFVGYKNMELYIKYIVNRLLPSGPLPEVKLAGISAGGFGALLNAPRLRAELPPNMPMSLLLDSSPPMNDQLFPSCQQQRMADTWNLHDTVIDDCNGLCTADKWLNPFFKNLLDGYPDMGVGLASTTYDFVIRSFAGLFGDPSCVKDPTEQEYTAGLLSIRQQMYQARGSQFNAAMFIVPGSSNHVFIDDVRYFNTEQDGVALKTWVEWQFDHSGAYPYLPPLYNYVGLVGQ